MSGCILAPWISTRNQAMQWKEFVGESAAWPSHIFQCSFLSPNKNAPDVWMDVCWKPQSSWFCFEISMPTWKGCPPRKNANVPWVDMLIFTAATFAAPCGAELQRESRLGRLHGARLQLVKCTLEGLQTEHPNSSLSSFWAGPRIA